jgi:hypothetical protein
VDLRLEQTLSHDKYGRYRQLTLPLSAAFVAGHFMKKSLFPSLSHDTALLDAFRTKNPALKGVSFFFLAWGLYEILPYILLSCYKIHYTRLRNTYENKDGT